MNLKSINYNSQVLTEAVHKDMGNTAGYTHLLTPFQIHTFSG
jgi:hypothetical protein